MAYLASESETGTKSFNQVMAAGGLASATHGKDSWTWLMFAMTSSREKGRMAGATVTHQHTSQINNNHDIQEIPWQEYSQTINEWKMQVVQCFKGKSRVK